MEVQHTVDVLNSLIETSNDRERGFRNVAQHSGSASGALRRGWVALLGTLSGSSDKALLEACERGEDSALERYGVALDSPLPANARLLVETQYEAVKRNHAQVRNLREMARTARA